MSIARAPKGRERLLSRTAAVVAVRGEANLTFAEVAAVSGVSEDDVQAEFGSVEAMKNALVESLDIVSMECINRHLSELPGAATPMDKIRAFASGYLCFAERHSSEFAAHMGIDASDLILQSVTTVYEQASGLALPCALYRLLGSLVRELMRDVGAPDGEWALGTRVLAVMASVHGLVHLYNYGVGRYLAPSARRLILESVLSNLAVGLERYLVEGVDVRHQPTEFVGSLDFEPPMRAKDLPRSTPEGMRLAILRGAVEHGAWHGVEEINLDDAAVAAGIAPSHAHRMFSTNEDLLVDMENYLEELNQSKITEQMVARPAGSPAVECIKAAGFGYIGHAVRDPEAFRALISVASCSIMPISFDIISGEFDMNVSFQGLLEMVRAAIVEGDGPRSAWALFTDAFSLWSYAHGLAQLFLNGSLRTLDVQVMFELADAVIGVTIERFVHGMEMQSRGNF